MTLEPASGFASSAAPAPRLSDRLRSPVGKPASRWLEGGTYGDGSDWWELSLCSRCHRELVADEERSLAELEALLDELEVLVEDMDEP